MKRNKVISIVSLCIAVGLITSCNSTLSMSDIEDTPLSELYPDVSSIDLNNIPTLSGDITVVNANNISVDDYGTSIYDSLSSVDFSSIVLDTTAPVADLNVLSVVSESSELIPNGTLTKVWFDFVEDAGNVLCTDYNTALRDNNLLNDALIAEIANRYVSNTSANIASDESKTSELWFTLSARDANGRDKKLYWRLGKDVSGDETAYFMCYPNLLVTGELAYYLIALYNNGYDVIDVNQLAQEYYGLLSSNMKSCAIYNRNTGKFAYILD